jgi:hypothetical protein
MVGKQGIGFGYLVFGDRGLGIKNEEMSIGNQALGRTWD